MGVTDLIAPIDPRSLIEISAIFLSRQIFEGPYGLTPQGEAVPLLFSEPLSLLPGTSGLQYRAPLRPGVLFSDGTRVEPAEIVGALQSDPLFASRASAELRGDSVALTLREANTRFELFLTATGFVFRQRPGGFLGTGPYRVEGPSGGECVRLIANQHARVQPAIKVIEARVFPPEMNGRPEALLAALERGEIDLAPRLSWRDVHLLKSTAVVLKPVNSTCIFYLNCERLTDARLRRAIMLAIDRQEVAQVAFGDNPLAFRASGLLPPALGKSHDGLSPDPTRARGLVQEMGGFKSPLTIAYASPARPYLPQPNAVARHIRDRLRRIGLTVETSEFPTTGALIGKLNSGEFDLALMGNVPDTADPADFFMSVLASEAVPSRAEGASFSFNYSRYRSAEFDGLLARFRRDRDPDTLAMLGKTIGMDAPILPLLYGRACVAHSWRVRGWDANVAGFADLSQMSLR